jgi:hypothetical protein
VSLDVPLYARIHVIIEVYNLTGHMIGSVILHLHCVTVSDFLSFFCYSEVIEKQSATCNLADVCSRMLPPLMKTVFLRQSCFVCPRSAFGTLQYLHVRMARKWAAAVTSPIVCCSSVNLEKRMRWRMQTGKAFCCVSLGSSFL